MQLFYAPEKVCVSGAEHVDLVYARVYKVVFNCCVEGGPGAAKIAAYFSQLTCELLSFFYGKP